MPKVEEKPFIYEVELTTRKLWSRPAFFHGKKAEFVAIEEASLTWGHVAMVIPTMQILDVKRSAGHQILHRSHV